MADISLREYLDKVDTLLKTGKSDEVILHARQILKHYPKNVAASRFLGQALVRGSGYKEAEPVLRRVLSVYPDDVTAHTSLSDMHDRQGKGDEAIWHIERALEGTPNDSGLIEKWRSLYQRYRKVEDPRFQLTTGAVARQYTRNGMYAQAIESLQTTLEKSPRRVDLRLLLAQTMWNAGMQVEGAETALDVLDVLPYCLEANRILTLLWLSEGRPSDAQRYLNQIQDVEPYLALQLAQNTAPDDEAFTVPELDYRRIAEAQINTDQPDWLTEIDEEAPAPVADMADADMPDFDLDDELPQAFLTDLEGDDAPVVTRPKTGMTGLLAALDRPQDASEDETADELPDWLLESAPQEAVLDELPSEEVDSLAWLEDSGTELADHEAEAALAALDFAAIQEQTGSLDWMEQPSEQEVPDLFAGADFAEAAGADQIEEHNPLAWLEGSGVELIDESEVPPAASLIDEEEMVYSDPETINPLAWLERSGVELVEEDDTLHTLLEASPQPEAETEDADPDPMSWLDAENPELEIEADELPEALSADGEDDALDWLSSADSTELPVSGFLDALPQNSTDEDSLDWLRDDSLLDEALNIEDLNDTGGVAAVSTGMPDDEQAVPDFFADMNHVTDRLPGSEAAISDSEFIGTGGQSEMSENDELKPQSDDSELSSFEWLNEQPEVEDSAQASASDLDWMTEIPDEQPEWLNEENGEIESAAPVTGGPDWLVEDAEAVTNEFGWLNDPDDEMAVDDEAAALSEMPDWLSAAAPDAEIEAEPAAEMAAMPDWLASAAPSDEDDEEAELDSEIVSESEAFDWSEEEPEAEPMGETPDWLSAIAPEAETEGEPHSEIEAGLDALEWEAEADEAEPAAELATMPDWLASAAPSDEDDEEAELDSEIVSESEAFDWSEEPEAKPMGETPDWLSAIAPEAETEGEPRSEIEAGLDALEWEAEADEAEPAAELATMPDWLASAAPSDEDEEEVELDSEIVSESEAFDWSEEEPEAKPMGETPDWLSAIAPEAETESESHSEIEAGLDALEWEAEADEAEPAAELATMPDWLASAAPSDEDEEEVELDSEIVSESEAFDWSEEEPEADLVGESSDWLSALAPDVEDEGEIQSEIEASLDALEWEAEAEEAAPAAELAAMPDWLASAAPSDEDEEAEFEPESEIAAESEAFDWSEEEPEAEPIGEMPDWLADAEPEAALEEDDHAEEAEVYMPPAASIAQTRILPEEDFGWSGDEGEAEPEYETDYEANPAHSQFGWLEEPQDELEEGDMDFEEKILASAVTPPPADNAPDWLNAMVPGLDLDYQAIEDDRPIEADYIHVPARREQPESAETGQPGNFNWLVDIVDEETGPMRAIQDTPDSARSRRRFTFSRQPAWLRTLMAQRGRTESQSDDDFDLPEWLR